MLVFTHPLIFIFSPASSIILILFQYLTSLLFSHTPNHSLPFSSNRSRFCLVTLFSNNRALSIFSNSPYSYSFLLQSLAHFQSCPYFLSILTLSSFQSLSIILLVLRRYRSQYPLCFAHLLSLIVVMLTITSHYSTLIIFTFLLSLLLSPSHTQILTCHSFTDRSLKTTRNHS